MRTVSLRNKAQLEEFKYLIRSGQNVGVGVITMKYVRYLNKLYRLVPGVWRKVSF